MDSPIPHRDTSWNPSLEVILKKEAEQSEGLYWLHNRSQTIIQRKNDWLMLPSIVISTINGFLIGAETGTPTLVLGGISILVSTLSSITQYYKYSQRAEGHRIAALMYLKLYKTIEIELAKPIDQRADPDDLLKSLKEQMTRVAETAPQPVEGAIREYQSKFKEDRVSHPIVANGLSEVRIHTGSQNTIEV